jgi:hypothetical protein
MPSEALFEDEVLDEERVRDQLSAAEELMYVGHREPALLAAGVALEGAIRLRAGSLAGHSASAGALLEALLCYDAVGECDYDLLYETLAARDRLVHGFAPRNIEAASRDRVMDVLAIVIRLLEPDAIPRRRG